MASKYKLIIDFKKREGGAGWEAEISDLRSSIEKALGSERYNYVSRFFFHVCTSQYPYKLLVTRRAFLLYKIFYNIFKNCKEALEPFGVKEFMPFGKVFNSHSISLLKEINKSEDKLLISDDIVVHGRSISNIYNEVTSMGIKAENISIWCIYCSASAECISNVTKKRMLVYHTIGSSWKTVSDAFTKTVIDSMFGYTSYVDTYLYNDNTSRLIAYLRQKKPKIVQMESPVTEKYNMESYVYFPKDRDQELKCLECIRFYINKKNRVLIIPYLFIAPIAANQARAYAISLLKKYNIEKIPVEFEKVGEEVEVCSLFLKWTVNQIGQKLINQFFQQHRNEILDLGSTEKIIFEKMEYQESYHLSGLGSDVPNCDFPEFEDFHDNLKSSVLESILQRYNNESTRSLQKDKVPDLAKLNEIYVKYSFEIKEQDEYNAKIKKHERIKGIDLYEFYDTVVNQLQINDLEKRENTLKNIAALYIMQWDTGCAAYNFDTITTNGQGVILACLMRNGEQVYQSVYLQYQDIYPFYKSFIQQTYENRPGKWDELTPFVQQVLINEIENKKNKKKQINRLKRRIADFRDLMKKDSSFFNDAFVVKVPKVNETVFQQVNQYIVGKYRRD